MDRLANASLIVFKFVVQFYLWLSAFIVTARLLIKYITDRLPFGDKTTKVNNIRIPVHLAIVFSERHCVDYVSIL